MRRLVTDEGDDRVMTTGHQLPCHAEAEQWSQSPRQIEALKNAQVKTY